MLTGLKSLNRSRLSEKVLALAILFVLLAETVIFIPSVANFRQDWLRERADQAGLVALALEGVPGFEGSEALSKAFMERSGVEMVAAGADGRSELLIGMPPDMDVIETIDLREAQRVPPIWRALRTLAVEMDGAIRVIDASPVAAQDRVEFVVPQPVLRDAMWDYFRNIIALSLIIAIITGLLIYLALSRMIVEPVRLLAAQLVRFRDDPGTQYNFGPRSRRSDEIGDLQREFRDMKAQVRASFRQRDRLATLGLAVAKINHDLRNILNAAQLVSDRIAMDPDERVRKMGQRLERVIDRGIRICTESLEYSREKTGKIDRDPIRIAGMLGEIAADTLEGFAGLQFVNRVPTGLTVLGDPDATYRLFHNLFRNAGQAMDAMSADAPRSITVRADVTGGTAHIYLADTGPGLPDVTKDNLFTPFASASGAGSTGLGLSISKELATAQGGNLDLVRSDESGTEFRVSLPVDARSMAAA